MAESSVCLSCTGETNIYNIFDTCLCEGNEEIYADMLKQCFDIEISSDSSLNGMCETCILKLRDAFYFRCEIIKSMDELKKASIQIEHLTDISDENFDVSMKNYDIRPELDPKTGQLLYTVNTNEENKETDKEISFSQHVKMKKQKDVSEKKKETIKKVTWSEEIEYFDDDDDDDDDGDDDDDDEDISLKENVKNNDLIPRNYKPVSGAKRYKKYDEVILKQAVQEYLTTDSSLSHIAEKYDISKSVLHRHSVRNTKKPGGQTVLSKETEDYIIKYINVCAEWGYPLDSLDLRFIVKMFLDKSAISQNKFKNNMPGPDFVKSFLSRHKDEISQRICQNIKRSTAAVSPEIIKSYFEELNNSIKDVPAENIVNYDETNLAVDPGFRKIITKRGTKYPERVMNHPNAAISVMMAGTADGQLLPPYVVYKADNLYNSWVTFGPKGTRYNRTSSGWFDGNTFEDWIQCIIIPFYAQKQGKKVLIGDYLSSHLSIDMIKLCEEHNISFVFLPANSTHLTQPLDVAFFRPLTTAWQQILLQWKKADGRQETCVPKSCFPKLLKLLMERIEENAADILRTAFRETGINPLNPELVLSRLPAESKDTERSFDSIDATDESVLSIVSEMRYETMETIEPKIKRKINIVAGKSVSENYEEDEEWFPETCSDLSMQIKKEKQNEDLDLEDKTENEKAKALNEGKLIGKKIIKTQHEDSNLEDNIGNKKVNSTNKGKGIGKKTIKKEIVKDLESERSNKNQVGLIIKQKHASDMDITEKAESKGHAEISFKKQTAVSKAVISSEKQKFNKFESEARTKPKIVKVFKSKTKVEQTEQTTSERDITSQKDIKDSRDRINRKKDCNENVNVNIDNDNDFNIMDYANILL